jgi:AraC family transcriptional regulator, regulatory protein of adaptative response / DNA-3-methyladenine glycosylase II
MDLDPETCRRARLARDARFDGRFFVGVKTTGVFCRPVCPAVPPRESNVQYFPSAAAASGAGFRACLRCRPETAPGTPAWSGASATVSRGLRLIAHGALDGDDIDALASRLGVGARHLRRLFVEHLGAPPIAVVQTHRLLAAKTLVDDTDLPLTVVAMAAGFGSIRRFNAAFLEHYGRSPSGLRALRRRPAAAPYSFELRYRPPFDWRALVGFLAPRAIPGVESVGPGRYRRSIVVDGREGWIEVVPDGKQAVRLNVHVPDPARLLRSVARVRRMFDLDADPMRINAHLSADRLLAGYIGRRPGLRVPGCWDWFELGVRAILGQQVTVAGATTLAGRLVQQFGRPLAHPAGGVTHTFPSAHEIADAGTRRLSVPVKRAEAVTLFAAAAASGTLDPDGMTSEEFVARLVEIPGIGPWTAQYIALRALGDPDAFPAQDLGLLRASGCRTARDLERRSQQWRPWRAYAAMHLWSGGQAKAEG